MEYVYEAVAYGLLFQDSERSMMSCLFLGLMKFSFSVGSLPQWEGCSKHENSIWFHAPTKIVVERAGL